MKRWIVHAALAIAAGAVISLALAACSFRFTDLLARRPTPVPTRSFIGFGYVLPRQSSGTSLWWVCEERSWDSTAVLFMPRSADDVLRETSLRPVAAVDTFGFPLPRWSVGHIAAPSEAPRGMVEYAAGWPLRFAGLVSGVSSESEVQTIGRQDDTLGSVYLMPYSRTLSLFGGNTSNGMFGWCSFGRLAVNALTLGGIGFAVVRSSSAFRAVRGYFRRRSNRCAQCGFSLRGLPPSARCPECGASS